MKKNGLQVNHIYFFKITLKKLLFGWASCFFSFWCWKWGGTFKKTSCISLSCMSFGHCNFHREPHKYCCTWPHIPYCCFLFGSTSWLGWLRILGFDICLIFKISSGCTYSSVSQSPYLHWRIDNHSGRVVVLARAGGQRLVIGVRPVW